VSDSAQSPAPRVSVVVPAYNREHYIGATLESVQAQTFDAWELVVFDDGSTDGTTEVVGTYVADDPRIRLASGPNGGVASARNRGFAETDPRSEFVIFLDSDDQWEPDALSSMVAVLDGHPDYVSVYGQARCMDDEGCAIPGDNLEEAMRARLRFEGRRLVPVPGGEPLTFSALAYHNWVTTPGLHVVRRSVLDEVGGFDPSTDPADDWDLVVRISRHGPIAFLDQIVLHWRRHGSTLTMTSPRWKRAYYAVRFKMLTDPSNTDEQRRVARDGYRWMTVDGMRQAIHALRARRWSEAVRHAGRSAQSVVQRLRAELALASARR
jgi:glycosyltransferase involved in cell wall biosynthesis